MRLVETFMAAMAPLNCLWEKLFVGFSTRVHRECQWASVLTVRRTTDSRVSSQNGYAGTLLSVENKKRPRVFGAWGQTADFGL
jgi:hypothetical protein